MRHNTEKQQREDIYLSSRCDVSPLLRLEVPVVKCCKEDAHIGVELFGVKHLSHLLSILSYCLVDAMSQLATLQC